MWALDNQTAYAADRTGARDRDGAELWLVAVKATYRIHRDGELELDPEQTPVEFIPRYRGKPGATSLICESDLTFAKSATDVILTGSAWAPGGEPASQVDVTLKAGTVSKTLRVFGDRYWERDAFGIRTTPAEPFLSIPIVYERAFGGVDPAGRGDMRAWESRNPVGVGFASDFSDLIHQPLPNVEYPGDGLAHGNPRPAPAGFGPVARDWSPRKEFAGTYDQVWMEERYPLVPVDFDDRFYQCAPHDQQAPGHLRGGETIELFNLTPEGYLSFILPKVWLTFRTRLGQNFIEHRSTLQTVWIEPDLARLKLVWLTMLPCHGRDHKLLGTRIAEKPYKPLATISLREARLTA